MAQLVMKDPDLPSDDIELTWVNVAIALSFILVDGTPTLSPHPTKLNNVVIFSIALGLGIEKSILVASIRCLVQLTIMVPLSV
jgi:uncharacterized membrane protein